MSRPAWLSVSPSAAALALAGVWLRGPPLAVTAVAGLVALGGWFARSVGSRLARASGWALSRGEPDTPAAPPSWADAARGVPWQSADRRWAG